MLPIELLPTTLSSSFVYSIGNCYKSDLLFLRLFPSMLISKRDDKEKMTVLEKDNGKKKKKTKICWGGVFSCFGDDSTVYDQLDVANKEFERKPVRKRAWSRFARKKKTVPIEIAGNGMDCEMKRRNFDRKKENNCKGQIKPAECPDQNKKQKQQKSISAENTISDIAELPVQHIASRSDILSKSAPLCRTLNPVQIQTQLPTSNRNSPELRRHSMPEISPREKEDTDREQTGRTDTSKIVPIITVAIILLLLFGRGFAIFCMCIYFYIVSRFKSETEKMDQMKKGSKEIDLNSEMHKKMVVLRGFLERDKKKPASNFGSPSR